MSHTNETSRVRWTKQQATILAVACLLAGIAGGWSIRGPRTQGPAASPTASSVSAPPANVSPSPAEPTPMQLEQMADAQAAPLLEKLKSAPDNRDLLAGVGNLYYDAHQYPQAVDFYARLLKIEPADAAVRTDMGTAFWYMGNSDRALAEFDKALAVAPNNPNTLFNRGLVRWKGKADAAGAVADWNKLLASYPKYQGRAQVERLLSEVKTHPANTAEIAR
jgi:tetratricopeptide (TPR) repeat protein